jgi:hypothetical protein
MYRKHDVCISLLSTQYYVHALFSAPNTKQKLCLVFMRVHLGLRVSVSPDEGLYLRSDVEHLGMLFEEETRSLQGFHGQSVSLLYFNFIWSQYWLLIVLVTNIFKLCVSIGHLVSMII